MVPYAGADIEAGLLQTSRRGWDSVGAESRQELYVRPVGDALAAEADSEGACLIVRNGGLAEGATGRDQALAQSLVASRRMALNSFIGNLFCGNRPSRWRNRRTAGLIVQRRPIRAAEAGPNLAEGNRHQIGIAIGTTSEGWSERVRNRDRFEIRTLIGNARNPRPVAPPAATDEKMPRQWVDADYMSGEGSESVETAPHVAEFGVEIDAHRGGEADHRLDRNASITSR